ncbi:MAG: peptidoglycan editing factor PgeF [Gammaproteobacteria bacterium]|nr:peptidoglycan editing factor PgeF [Gammaproteobacteria bacterium]
MEYIQPDWPAPPQVKAVTTTRAGGLSSGPYRSLNLATHVADAAAAVAANRDRLSSDLALPAAPRWLDQRHTTTLIDAACAGGTVVADGAVAARPGEVCAILTADCLPLLLCDRAGTTVAALHVGWRGLFDGIVQAGITRLVATGTGADNLLAWIGPGISQRHYQVGPEFRERFVERNPDFAPMFAPDGTRWRVALDAICESILQGLGVTAIYRSGLCTCADGERFFSYRRDGTTGRMATLIWLDEPPRGSAEAWQAPLNHPDFQSRANIESAPGAEAEFGDRMRIR